VPFSFSLSENENGVLTAAFELYFKSDLSLPRLGALRCAPCTVRLCWGKASLGARLAARFLLILMRVRLGRLAAARARQPAVASSLQFLYNKKRTVFNNRVRPLSACAILKTSLDGANAEPIPNNA